LMPARQASPRGVRVAATQGTTTETAPSSNPDLEQGTVERNAPSDSGDSGLSSLGAPATVASRRGAGAVKARPCPLVAPASPTCADAVDTAVSMSWACRDGSGDGIRRNLLRFAKTWHRT
jgi:hypothetical protein